MFSMSFQIQHPASLLLLAVALLIWKYVAANRPRDGGGGQWRKHILRCIALVTLCLALADPIVTAFPTRRYVVLLKDVSPSAGDESRKRADRFVEQVKSIRGSNRVRVVSPPIVDESVAGTKGRFTSTDIATAMFRAAAEIPAGYRGEIVLLSDGRKLREGAVLAALGLTIPISVVPLDTIDQSEAAIVGIETRARARSIDRLPVEVLMESGGDNRARLRLLQDGQVVAQREVTLTKGRNRAAFYVSRGTESMTHLQAELVPERDTIKENNRWSALIGLDAPVRVLVVTNSFTARSAFHRAIARAGCQVQVVDAKSLTEEGLGNDFELNDFELNDFELNDFDLIVLQSIAANGFSKSQLRKLQQTVEEHGAGLVVAGGKDTFDPSEMTTPLDFLLPVTAEQLPPEPKTVALVLVVDKSSSMLEERRLDLAKQAARQSVSLLSAEDKVGVIAFGNDTPWVHELARYGDGSLVKSRVDAIRASGRTNMYPALRRARIALRQTVADKKHIIVLTDGVASPGDFDGFARRLADSGITLSAVSISPGAERQILIDMARVAGGRHYHCDNPRQVPEILVQETQNAVSQRETVSAELVQPLPWLSLQGAPALADFIYTRPKPGSHVVVTAGNDGPPLLAWWPFGQGKVVALPTDLASGKAGAWNSWAGADEFWVRITALAARQRRTHRESMRLVPLNDGRDVGVSVDVSEQGQWSTGARVDVRVGANGDGDSQRSARLEQAAPGRYQGVLESIDSREVVTMRLDAAERTAQRSVGVVRNYPEELRVGPINLEKLQDLVRITGGTFDIRPEQVFQSGRTDGPRRYHVWAYFVVVGLLVFVAEIMLRRGREWGR